MAEWLGKALQKLPQRFESARDLLLKKQPKILDCFFNIDNQHVVIIFVPLFIATCYFQGHGIPLLLLLGDLKISESS